MFKPKIYYGWVNEQYKSNTVLNHKLFSFKMERKKTLQIEKNILLSKAQ